MTVTNFLVFCLAYTIAVASPGPGVVALVARVLSQGLRIIVAFGAGFVIGDLVWFTFAATGLAIIAQTFYAVFLAIKYLGAIYLLYLAYRFWNAPTQPTEISTFQTSESLLQRFLSGLAITLGNPKVMVFFLAILPTVVDISSLNVLEFIQIAIAITVIFSSVFATYALTANRARQLFSTPRSVRWLNRSSGVAMAGTAVVVATQKQ